MLTSPPTLPRPSRPGPLLHSLGRRRQRVACRPPTIDGEEEEQEQEEPEPKPANTSPEAAIFAHKPATLSKKVKKKSRYGAAGLVKHQSSFAAADDAESSLISRRLPSIDGGEE